MQEIVAQPLTKGAFAPFGDVIETAGAELRLINNGTTQRFHDIANIETDADGKVSASIFRGQPFTLPVEISMMERHPLGSQAFIPLHQRPWLVVVAQDENGRPGRPQAFLVKPNESGVRGVNYARNVWHHPLISLEVESDFLVIDRDGPGGNLEEYFYPEAWSVAAE